MFGRAVLEESCAAFSSWCPFRRCWLVLLWRQSACGVHMGTGDYVFVLARTCPGVPGGPGGPGGVPRGIGREESGACYRLYFFLLAMSVPALADGIFFSV